MFYLLGSIGWGFGGGGLELDPFPKLAKGLVDGLSMSVILVEYDTWGVDTSRSVNDFVFR